MITRHLRQNAVAYLALAVALSTGTAYAANTIPNGSVTTKKLAKNAVVSKKVANGSLTGLDVADRSLAGADVAAGALGSAEIGDGTLTDDDLATGSVGSAEVKNGSLTAPDLAEGSVGSNEVKNGSLVAADLAAGLVPGDTQISVGTGELESPVNPITPFSGAYSSRQLTLAAAGHAYVRWTMPSLGITCNPVASAVAGLFVDGVAVAGSGVPLANTDNSRFVEVSGYVALGAGAHTLAIGVDCPDPSIPGSSGAAGPSSWTTIVPGE